MADDSILPMPQDLPQQQDAEADAAGFTSLVLQTFRADVDEALAAALLPAARDISRGFEEIQEQAAQAASDSQHELAAAQAEVERVSRLIFSFQQALLSVLPPMH